MSAHHRDIGVRKAYEEYKASDLPMFAKQDFFYPNTHDCYEDIPWTLMMPFDEPRVVRGDYLNPNIAETSRTLLEIRFTRLENLMFTAVICPPDQNVESREFRDEGLLPVDDIVILPDDEMLFVVLHNVGSMLVAMQGTCSASKALNLEERMSGLLIIPRVLDSMPTIAREVSTFMEQLDLGNVPPLAWIEDEFGDMKERLDFMRQERPANDDPAAGMKIDKQPMDANETWIFGPVT